MNKKLFSRAAPALLGVLLTIGAMPALAAVDPGGMMPMPKPAMVLQQIHMVNQFEIKAGEMAMQKATKTPIKRYGDRLRRDHTLADGKVEMLAKQLGFELKSPAQMQQMMQKQQMGAMGSMGSMGGQASMQPMQKMQKMQMMQQTKTKLQSASGPEFDQTYVMAMIKGHQKAIQMLEKVRRRSSTSQS